MKLNVAYPYVLERAFHAAEFAFGDTRLQRWFYRRVSQQIALTDSRLSLQKLRPLTTIQAELEAIDRNGTIWKDEVLPAIMRSWGLLHEGRRRGEPVYNASAGS